MKRILVVSNVYPPHVVGGAEIVADRQVRELAALGFQVAVFAGRFAQSDDRLGSLTMRLDHDVPVYTVVIPPPADPSRNFHRPEDTRRFASVLAVHRPDIVHFHNVVGLGCGLIPLASARGCHVIVTLHDYWGMCFKNTLVRNDRTMCKNVEECDLCQPTIDVRNAYAIPMRIRRDYVAWCLSFADRLLSPSAYLMQRFRDARLVDRPIEHLSNGIPERQSRQPGPASRAVRFACFSYLGEHKGIPTLLRAAEVLAQDVTLQGLWHLTLAGHGHLSKTIAEAIEDGRFGGAVSYVGRLAHDEAQELQAKSHVIVLASEWPENEPVTLLEAVQSGTAQIASRIGGNCDLVDDGRSGLLFEPGDAHSLARVMRQLIETPALAAEFGAYNASRREAFQQSKTIKRLKEIYDSVEKGPAREDFVVICSGRSSSAEYSQRVRLLISRFYKVEDRPGIVRFVWKDWADSHVWESARLLWFWGDVDDRDLPLLRRAVRAGVTCLIPSEADLSILAEGTPQMHLYDTLLEALGYVAALQDGPVSDGGAGHQLLAAISPDETFTLALEV